MEKKVADWQCDVEKIPGSLRAFHRFCNQKSPLVSRHNPDFSYHTMKKVLGVEWQALSKAERLSY